MVFGEIIAWVRNTIIGKAIAKLVTFFNPAGAIVQAVMGIYNTVMFIRDKADQIKAFTSSIFESVKNIAAGIVSGAADYIEGSIGKAIPLMIGFLARLIGLGGISEKIKKTIQKIKGPIDKGVKKAVTWIAGKAKAFGGAVKKGAKGVVDKGKEVVGNIKEWWTQKEEFRTKGGKKHTLLFRGQKSRARLRIRSTEQDLDFFLNKFKDQKNKAEQYNKSLRIYNDIVTIIRTSGNKTIKDSKGNMVPDPAFTLDLDGKIEVLKGCISILEDSGDHRIKTCNIKFNKPKASFNRQEYYSQ